VHYDDAWSFQSLLIDKRMMRVVPHLKEDAVELFRVEPAGRLREYADVGERRERFQQRGGVIGNPALGGRQRREKGDPNC